MVSQILPSELKLNKAYTSDTKAAFLDLHLSISNNTVSSKTYDKRDDFDFEIVNFPFKIMMFLALHPMESISPNSFVFAKASSHVADFNTHNKLLSQKCLKQKDFKLKGHVPLPSGEFCRHIHLKVNFKPYILIYFCTLYARALACYSLLHMLL